MSRFVTSADTKAIHADWWESEESVTIKKFNYGDRQRLAGEFMQMRSQMKPGDESVEEMMANFNVERYNLVILELGIVDWTFTLENGRRAPPNPRTIAQLHPEDADFIVMEINAFNPKRSRAERESFRGDNQEGAEE